MAMFDRRIEIQALSQERDDYNERMQELVTIAVTYAQKTESGGRENFYASRIPHENEVAYTIRYRDSIRAGQYVKDGDFVMKIESVHEEGRMKILHLKTRKTDAES